MFAINWVLALFWCTPVWPWCGTAGFLTDDGSKGDVFVTAVTDGGPAARAGIRQGDAIVLRDAAFRERWRLRSIRDEYSIPAGEHLSYVLRRGNQLANRIVVPDRIPGSWGTPTDWKSWAGWAFTFSTIWGLAFAAILALRRPELVQARLLSAILILNFGLGSFTGMVLPWWPSVDFVIVTIAIGLSYAGATLLSAVLAMNFAAPASMLRRALYVFAIALASVTCMHAIISKVGSYVFAVFPIYGFYDSVLEAAASGGLSFVTVLSLLLGASAATGEEKTRARWIAASLAPVWLLNGLSTFVFFGTQQFFNAMDYVLGAASILMPVGLTYATLKRRCIDIGFVLNRAAVVAGVSLIVVGAFVLLEWALGKWFEDASHTTSLALNVGLALALGISLRYIHGRVDRFVDRVMFRKRHEDESALRRFAHEASYISDYSTLLERAVRTVRDHTSADDAAILVREGAAYAFATDGRRETVSQDDPVIVALRAWHKPVDLHQVKDSMLHGELALPMISRGELVGTLVCGAKRDGEAYAPDESDALLALAHGVGTAIHVLEAKHDGTNGVSPRELVELREAILAQFQLLREAIIERHP